jgi:methylaspartate ammonia-lyase
MLIVDFSKAFDVVPHIRLLRKLEHYGIKGKILEWIRAWLTQRRQCVVVDGETSEMAHVKSGVPQRTVLGPLMFLLYILLLLLLL